MSATTMEMPDLFAQVAGLWNKEVEEFNAAQEMISELRAERDALLEDVDSLTAEVSQLNDTLELQKLLIDKQRQRLGDREELMKKHFRIESQITKLEDKEKVYLAEIKALKAENPKKLKAHNTKLKVKNVDLVKRNDQLVKDNRDYRKEVGTLKELLAQARLTGVYHKGNQHLMLMPSMTSVWVDGVKQEGRQITLLFTDQQGVWRQVTLDDEDELAQAKLNCGHLGVRTQQTIEKVMPQMAIETHEFAEMWLRKVKRQGWAVTENDLAVLGAMGD